MAQFEKLPLFFKKRQYIHNYYNEHLKGIPCVDLPPALPDYMETSYYFYHIQITNGKRDVLAKYLRENGIYTTYRYYPLHRVPGFKVSGLFPGADYASDHTLCLPLHQGLTEDDLRFIVEKIREFMLGSIL